MTTIEPGVVERLVERLRKGADYRELDGDIGLPHTLREAATLLAQQQARIGEMEGALRPFARAAANVPDGFDGGRAVKVSIDLTSQEQRRMRAGSAIKQASLIISFDGITTADFRRARAIAKDQP